jgi:hypothetical protein
MRSFNPSFDIDVSMRLPRDVRPMMKREAGQRGDVCQVVVFTAALRFFGGFG